MDWYQRELVDTGRATTLWALVGYLVTFAIVRGITRRIHARAAEGGQPAGQGRLHDVYIAGVHVHHQVWGILLVLVTGLLDFRVSPDPPWAEVLAALFGAGAALVLDEFALWFHLDDVYWADAGRTSIDAVLTGTIIGIVLLLQATPVGPATNQQAAGTVAYLATVVLHLATAAVCIGKGKISTGLVGVVVPLVATVGALRLAKPTSPWARHRYTGAKLARSQQRFGERYQERHDQLRDLVGGRPDDAGPPDDDGR